jgi:ring-1,2-phenylacetyl-CoA epoxidase subunit PaaE
MSRFHTLRVKDVKKETPETVSVELDIPQELKDVFRFKAGQYLTFKVKVNGEELRRSYSICSSPFENSLRVAVKEIENGRVSGYFNHEVKSGHVLEVMPPLGNFTTEPSASNRKAYVAFAAGSGITPIISIIKAVLEGEPSSTFRLFYGNRDGKSVIFKDELERLQARYSDRLNLHFLYSRQPSSDPLFEGRISKDKIEALSRKFPAVLQADEYFLCGPKPMIEAASGLLNERGVDKSKVHFELFTNAIPGEAAAQDESTPETSGPESNTGISKVLVILDGDETEIEVDAQTTILDAALDAGLDVPYACTGGSCCTCRAKTIEGHADMEVNYALTDQEVTDGYILTCQAHPTTPRMVVDYDAS